LIAYTITLIGILFIFTISIEQVNAAKPSARGGTATAPQSGETAATAPQSGETAATAPQSGETEPQNVAPPRVILDEGGGQPQPTTGGGQPQTTTTTTTPGGGETIFRNTTDGFQVQVPTGWLVEDIGNTDINVRNSEEQSGHTLLARICPQNTALPLIGRVGKYQCQEGSTAAVHIMRFSNLYGRPEFASVGNRNITTSDLLSYYIQLKQNNSGISNIEIWNNTDTTVNITSVQTNQTVATIPAKLIEYTYYTYSGDPNRMIQYREFTLLVLNGTTGYSLFYEGAAPLLPSGRPPSQVQQIFDSFGLL
jgi:hypothetical protein